VYVGMNYQECVPSQQMIGIGIGKQRSPGRETKIIGFLFPL